MPSFVDYPEDFIVYDGFRNMSSREGFIRQWEIPVCSMRYKRYSREWMECVCVRAVGGDAAAAELVRLYKQGVPIPQLMIRYGLKTPTCIITILQMYGVEINANAITNQYFKDYCLSKNVPIDKVVSDYKSGVAIHEIAEKYNIHPRCIYYFLEHYGEKSNRPKRGSVDQCLDIVEKLYKEGVPVKEIARQCGSMSTVYRALDRLEAMGRIRKRRGHYTKHRRLSKEELEQIKKLYEQGASIYEIARRLNRQVSTIAYALKKLGLK